MVSFCFFCDAHLWCQVSRTRLQYFHSYRSFSIFHFICTLKNTYATRSSLHGSWTWRHERRVLEINWTVDVSYDVRRERTVNLNYRCSTLTYTYQTVLLMIAWWLLWQAWDHRTIIYNKHKSTINKRPETKKEKKKQQLAIQENRRSFIAKTCFKLSLQQYNVLLKKNWSPTKPRTIRNKLHQE